LTLWHCSGSTWRADGARTHANECWRVCAAICHTRWATHGEPSARNSHPITSSPAAEFTVVHNGIITNFAKLRAFLEEEGQIFHTDTDTEVIPKLCALIHANLEAPLPFSQLVMQVLRKLEGAYAVLVQSVYYPGELVCCRKGSPVVFAVKNTQGAQLRRFRTTRDLHGDCFDGQPLECFIASDDKAIIEHARVRMHLCAPIIEWGSALCPLPVGMSSAVPFSCTSRALAIPCLHRLRAQRDCPCSCQQQPSPKIYRNASTACASCCVPPWQRELQLAIEHMSVLDWKHLTMKHMPACSHGFKWIPHVPAG
jgi:hypothetical protein